MNSKEIKKKVDEEGFIHAIVVFEVLGSPKEYVEKSLQNHIDKLKDEKNIEIISTDIEVPQEQDKLWSTFAEMELLVKNLETFTWLCLHFMPASVEIMAPETLSFKGRDLTNWLNDMLAKNHEIALASQQVGAQSKNMLKSINALIRNSILICVDNKITKQSEISKKIGVSEKDLEPMFEAMQKEGKLKKEGTEYLRK